MSFGRRPWRFWMMQAALCAVLALTLCLAAWVTHLRQQKLRVAFTGDELTAGMHIPHPQKWLMRQIRDGIVFEEPESDGVPGRSIQVRRIRSAGFMSPIELLALADEIRPSELSALRTDKNAAEGDLMIAGWPGVLISEEAVGMVNRNQAFARKHLLGCAVLPSGDAVVVILDGLGIAQEADRDLLVRLARGIAVEGAPHPRAGGEVELTAGVRLTIPDHFAAPAQKDKFRVDVPLMPTVAGGWLAVDLVSCYFPQGYGPAEFAAILRARDGRFIPGEVHREGADTLVCLRQADAAFPAVAYLKRNADNRAVLAEFRWTAGVPGSAVDALWKTLSTSIQFQEAEPLDKLIERGGKALEKRPPDSLDLLDRDHRTETWQGYQETATQDWFTRIVYQWDSKTISADTRIGRWPSTRPAGSAPRQDGDSRTVQAVPRLDSFATWTLTRDWKAYESTVTRVAGGVLLTRRTIMRDGKILMSVDGVNQPIRAEQANFVPGGVLPLLMGKLPLDLGMMVLQTDSLPSPTQIAPIMPMLLILDPAFDVPRYYGEETEPMRCWAGRINGTGQISRWYFDKTGRLQVISFPGGVHLQRVEEEEEK